MLFGSNEMSIGGKGRSFTFLAGAMALMLQVGCGGPVPVDNGAPGSGDAVAAGDITLGKSAPFKAKMGEMDDLPYDYEYGVDFVFGLKMDQSAHLMIEDSRNYDCDLGTTLLGPSYYLFMEDGTTRVYDYQSRSAYSNIPGKSSPNYPDLVPEGTHRLVVRYFANGVCRMDGSIKVSDRFSPEKNSNFVTDYSLLRNWKAEGKTLTFSSNGTFTWTNASSELSGKVYNFPLEEVRKIVLVIENSSGTFAEKYSAEQRIYCSYETSGSSSSVLRVQCSEPSKTTFPANFEGAEEFTR